MALWTGVRTESVDYLQRCMQPVAELDGTRTAGAREVRRLLHVRGVGRPDRAPERPPRAPAPGEPWRAHTAGLITGLYGYRIPVAFWLCGAPDGVRVQLGVWSSRNASPEAQDRRREVLRAVLGGLYTTVDVVEQATDEASRGWPVGGIALGVPDPAGIEEADGSAPVDRIIASLTGTDWAVLVLAYPVGEPAIGRVRQQVLNELRAIATGAQAEGAPSPLAEQYGELLKIALASLGQGMATGAWRTGVYLLGDDDSYPRLAAAWRSVFSGVRSLPEPVRVLDLPAADGLASAWALPDQAGVPGPGHYQRPYELQTLLTTAQLAAYVHLPELETPGFAVETVASFDAVPSAGRGGERLSVGRILHRRRETASDFGVPVSSLTRHAFVAGVTGAGKTNTLFHLLAQVHRLGVPFLVLEPAKTEYRVLLDHQEIGPDLRVFTLGDERVAPIRLNPFAVPEGTTVSEHLDLLRAAFGASFGMWTPLPQILETCLHEVYADRGWELRTNRNRRVAGGPPPAAAFPTLSQLVDKVNEVVPTLGYEDRVTADLRAALVTRLDSLRRGGKGAMLDVERSTPAEELFGRPCVLELESVGDDGDKAFLMAMMLIRLAEHRRAAGPVDQTSHLLIVEEAHRLLSKGPQRASEEMADPRGQAVDSFVNLLAEVRAYGQGIAIIDQVPTRLAPEALKNTALKIAHRVVAADDRAALSATMAMTAEQDRALVTLGPGQAAVFSEGTDAPLLAAVPLVKASGTLPDATVSQRMASLADAVAGSMACPAGCVDGDGQRACEAAQVLLDERAIQRVLSRVVLSVVVNEGALDRLWPELVATLAPRRPSDVELEAVLASVCRHGARWYAERRGSQAGWDYATTTQLADAVRDVLVEKAQAGARAIGTTAAATGLIQLAWRLDRHDFPPYQACDRICQGDGTVCHVRWAAADLVASGRYREAWRSAEQRDTQRGDHRRLASWNVCQDAAYELIEFPEADLEEELVPAVTDSARRASLCFGQQLLTETANLPRTTARIMARLLQEAGL